MIEYILFEKKAEGDNPVWDKDRAIWFCKEQDVKIVDVTEELEFIVVKTGDDDKDKSYRLVEVTPTISFLFRDDPSLDEFMEVETAQNATRKYDDKYDEKEKLL